MRLNTNTNEFGPAWEPCACSCDIDEPEWPPTQALHVEQSDVASEAWGLLIALIDDAADDGRHTFEPRKEIPQQLWRQVVTLPASIGKLTEVRSLSLYGSNLIAIPPEIGQMTSLEDFDPYTSRRLHWFPFEIARCKALRSSRVSTRHLYGNYKTRLRFPALPSTLPAGSIPSVCSICGESFPPTGPIMYWVSLRIATDVLPLLVHACSNDCLRTIPRPPEYPCMRNMSTGDTWCYSYADHPHRGGPDLEQPPGSY